MQTFTITAHDIATKTPFARCYITKKVEEAVQKFREVYNDNFAIDMITCNLY